MSDTRYEAYINRQPNMDGQGLYIMQRQASHTLVLCPGGREWQVQEEYAALPEPSLFLPRDSYKALVQAVLVDKYGALPHDQLLRDRLDIETRRVDQLIEAALRG